MGVRETGQGLGPGVGAAGKGGGPALGEGQRGHVRRGRLAYWDKFAYAGSYSNDVAEQWLGAHRG